MYSKNGIENDKIRNITNRKNEYMHTKLRWPNNPQKSASYVFNIVALSYTGRKIAIMNRRHQIGLYTYVKH